jgi:hypothetical protein
MALAAMVTLVEASHEAVARFEHWREPGSCSPTSPAGKCTMRGDRWRSDVTFGAQELRSEMIKNAPGRNSFLMRVRREGETNLGDSGRRTTEYRLGFANSFTNPAIIDHLEANFKVQSIDLVACSTNETPGVTSTRTRPALLRMSAFNDGTSPAPGDRTGDVFVTIQAFRDAVSTDPPGVLPVDAFISRCNHPTCNTTQIQNVAPSVPLPNVSVGPGFVLRVTLDKPNDKFIVSVLVGGVLTTADLSYAGLFNDAGQSVQPFAEIDASVSTANCTVASGGPTLADAQTLVRKVKTNVSAIIP